MAEQIYPLTFEGREFNPRILGGLGVLNTPLISILGLGGVVSQYFAVHFVSEEAISL